MRRLQKVLMKLNTFFVKDNKLLKKCNEIWDKFSNSIK